MKKDVALFIVLITLITALMGCAIKKPPQKIELNANGQYTKTSFSLGGNASLPKGSILELQFSEIGKSELIYDKKIQVEEKGIFSWSDTNLDTSKDYSIDLVFNPRKQSEEIQKKYGKNGEYIKDGDFSGLIKNKDGVQVVKKSTSTEKLVGVKKGGIFYFQSPK
ncbi:hypothetical protein [Bacillus sp. EAC]|uniref:hypothetical protein n=1 Tax=Bacillus sp. EAC TaxID=1978338 RepID=UPI000B44EFEF|nr:hypothetical protein [Bacillus sp. EAC]